FFVFVFLFFCFCFFVFLFLFFCFCFFFLCFFCFCFCFCFSVVGFFCFLFYCVLFVFLFCLLFFFCFLLFSFFFIFFFLFLFFFCVSIAFNCTNISHVEYGCCAVVWNRTACTSFNVTTIVPGGVLGSHINGTSQLSCVLGTVFGTALHVYVRSCTLDVCGWTI